MNFDGQKIEMSKGWRIATRAAYRRFRRGGLGPMGARAKVEQQLTAGFGVTF